MPVLRKVGSENHFIIYNAGPTEILRGQPAVEDINLTV